MTNQLRKTKKIEIEIYEDQEIELFLSLLEMKSDKDYEKNVIQTISLPFNTEQLSKIITETFVQGVRKEIKFFWRYFYRASKHNNSKFYSELSGNTLNDFYQRKIVLLLSIIFGVNSVLKEIRKKEVEASFVSAHVSNKLFNLLLVNESFINNRDDIISMIPLILKISNSPDKYFKEHESVTFADRKISRNDIHALLLSSLLLQNKLFRDETTLEHLIIEQLYEELKGQYQFSKHAISIIIGFVLSRLGILMTEDEYDESSGDKKNSWREYLKNYVNYKIEVKSVVDSNDIVFEGKPLLEEKMKPLSSEMLSFLYSTFREDRNKA